MAKWMPIESAPKIGPSFAIAMPVVASPHHPTANQGDLLYWEVACVSPEQLAANVPLDDHGFDAQDFTLWCELPPFPDYDN